MADLKAEIEQFLRDSLVERLAQCTPSQQEMFHRIFAGEVPANKLTDAIALCDRTIRSNAAANEKASTDG